MRFLLLFVIFAPQIAFTQSITYLGGKKHDFCNGGLVTPEGRILIAGAASSPDFPTTFGSPKGGQDIFLTRMDKDLSCVLTSTRYGGSGHEQCAAIALDKSGNILLAGTTNSLDFPMTKNAYQSPHRGGNDLFVFKLDPGMKRILASTVIGGEASERCCGLALDNQGNIYLSGCTRSSNYPTTPNAFDVTFNSGAFKGDYQGNIFISKLNKSLTKLLASTYLGGKGGETMGSLALDQKGNVFITGSTRSLDFPILKKAFDPSFNSPINSRAGDVFVTKLNADLSQVLGSTYLGGPGGDWGYHMALDLKGNVYITGHVDDGFPVSKDAFDNSFNDKPEYFANSDAFAAKLDNNLEKLLASTFLGGPGEDIGSYIIHDHAGHVYLTGVTRAAGFPTLKGVFHPKNPQYEGDVFVSKLTDDLKTLKASTLYGGSRNEGGVRCLFLDKNQNVFVAGRTSSPDLLYGEKAYDPSFNGQTDVFVLKLKPMGSGI